MFEFFIFVFSVFQNREFKMYSDTDIWDTLNDIGRERNIYKSDSDLNDLHRVALSWRNVGLLPLVSVKRKYGGDRMNVTISQVNLLTRSGSTLNVFVLYQRPAQFLFLKSFKAAPTSWSLFHKKMTFNETIVPFTGKEGMEKF